MIFLNHIRSLIRFSFIILFTFLIGFYSSNKNLVLFNNIVLEGNTQISSELFFQEINYKHDSIKFYNKETMNLFLSKIKNFENHEIIENIDIYYSLPNNMVIKINERDPIYIIDNKVNKFALDDKGRIFNTKFISNDIPEVDLNFLVYHIYNRVTDIMILKDFFDNTRYNRLNDKYLLDGLQILTWLNQSKVFSKIQSLLINKDEIHVSLDKTKIIFNKDDIENQFFKLRKITENLIFLDSLKIHNISDLREINLCFNNQIIIKK